MASLLHSNIPHHPQTPYALPTPLIPQRPQPLPQPIFPLLLPPSPNLLTRHPRLRRLHLRPQLHPRLIRHHMHQLIDVVLRRADRCGLRGGVFVVAGCDVQVFELGLEFVHDG